MCFFFFIQLSRMGTLAKIVRYTLFGANCIILICGIAVFTVGAWTLVRHYFMERLLGTKLYLSSASILIVTGITVCIISFLGCYGAIKRIKWMLATYFLILMVIFITMLIGGILGYVFRYKVGEKMKREMITTVPLYMNDTVITDAWDAVQQYFKCCGLSIGSDQGYKIWSRNPNFTGDKKVPESCCKQAVSVSACQSSPEANTYSRDCYVQMRDFTLHHARVLGGIGIGISFVLILGMILSFSMFLLIE
ncbi:CD151 antigen-like [Stegodyphus dumicola]|uniref:CD151 antigen-like n=1 Tax=Stegodyphus dumicola TaxID=202533 RepID=UPI0015B11BC7|nr:CD151 antigen-like [Stegodyphus dumicola]